MPCTIDRLSATVATISPGYGGILTRFEVHPDGSVGWGREGMTSPLPAPLMAALDAAIPDGIDLDRVLETAVPVYEAHRPASRPIVERERSHADLSWGTWDD